MKNIFISAGLVAIGAAATQSAMADAMPQPWTVSATLRGFYDDNYLTAHNNKRDSFGVEVSPSLSANMSLQQTDFGVRYTYGLIWYQDRQVTHQDPFDQTHQLDFWLDHAFNERWKINFSDTLGIGQEPELIDPTLGSASGTLRRSNGDNVGNHFNVSLDTQWTRQFSTDVHYSNDFYDYQNDNGNQFNPSLAGLLNRDEQRGGIDLRWAFQPETVGFVGYTIDWVAYTGDEAIGYDGLTATTFYSRNRDLLSHQFYLGLKHQFTSNLSATAKVGAAYSDNYNDNSAGQSKTQWTPYANASLTYTYMPGSYVQLGVTHDINATDVGVLNGGSSLTQYQESTIAYASINHHFTDKFFASLIGQIQYSDYRGGASSKGADVAYSVGADLGYQFNQFLMADVGYNYNNLDSDISGRGYDRNRVHVGVTATY